MNKRLISVILSFIMCFASFSCVTVSSLDSGEEQMYLEQINNGSQSTLRNIIEKTDVFTEYERIIYNKDNSDYKSQVLFTLFKGVPYNSLSEFKEEFSSVCEEVYYKRRYGNVNTALRNITMYDSGSMEYAIERFGNDLCIDVEYFMSLEYDNRIFVGEKICEQSYNPDQQSFSDFRKAFNDAVLLVRIRLTESSDEMRELFEMYGSALQLDYSKYYNELDEEYRNEVFERMISQQHYDSLDEVREQFERCSKEAYEKACGLYDDLNNVGSPEELHQLIEREADKLELDREYYDKLNFDFQLEVCSRMVGYFYVNVDEFRMLFWDMVLEVYAEYKNNVFNDMTSASDPDETKQMLDQYSSLLGLDMSDYNALDEDGKRFVCEYLMRNSYNDIDSLRKAFEEAVVVVQINNASDIRELWDITEANMDMLRIYDSTYYNVDKKYKIYAKLLRRDYRSIEQYADAFRNAVRTVYRKEYPNASVGGGYGGFDIYFLTADYKKIETEPEQGTEVKVVVRAIYEGETDVAYIAAVYDADGRMIGVTTHESTAVQKGESEFFEFNADFDCNHKIKIFRVENMGSLKPLSESFYEYFRYGMELPIPEEETEGIIAVKGFLTNISSEESELNVINMRKFGYWGVRIPEEPLRIRYSGVLGDIYKKIGVNSVIFELSENTDGTYSIVSVKYEGELVHFSSDEIITATADTLTVSVNGEEVSYGASGDTNFLYEDFATENYIYVVDGKVIFIYPYEYRAGCVVSVGSMDIMFENGIRIEFDDDSFTKNINPGDVVFEWSGTLFKAGKVEEGVFYEDRIETVSGSYTPDFVLDKYGFAEGQKCLAYFDPDGRYIMYIKKNYESREVLLVKNICIDESGGLTLSTNKGDIALDGEVYLDGMLLPTELLYHHLQNARVISIDRSGSTPIIETASMKEKIKGAYIAKDKNLAGYSLVDGNYVARTSDNVYLDISLKETTSYEIEVYSFDGVNADFIIIPVHNISALGNNGMMYVTEVIRENDAPAKIKGYYGGEEVTFGIGEDADAWEAAPGDIVGFTELNGEILQISIIADWSSGMKRFAYTDYSTFSPVERINGNYITFIHEAGNNIYYAREVTEDTVIHIANPETGTVKEGSIRDIRTYQYYGDMRDYVLIEKYPNVVTVKYVLIYRY